MEKVGVFKLFVYGSLLPGEMHHHLLDGCPSLGSARTASGFRLVELALFPCMVTSGVRSVEGEVYELDRATLAKLDQVKENGRLFRRHTIALASGERVETYLMLEEQVRGRRRLHVDAWKDRFKPRSARTL